MLLRSSITNIAKRHAASAVQSKARHEGSPSLPKDYEVKFSRLPSGLTVLSQDNNSPISRVQFVVAAGSRYETVDNYGVTHQLRNLVAQGTKNLVGVDLCKHVSELSTDISVSSSREHVVYSVEFLRESVFNAVPLLAEVALNQALKHYEIADLVDTLKMDRIEMKAQPQTRVMELLHSAAYRQSGLGNSLFSPKYMIGKHTSEMLRSYLNAHFVTGRTSLVAYGVDHGLLLKFAADNLEIANGAGQKATPSKFVGGEKRKATAGELTHIAIATEGAALSDAKASTALAVLTNALGTGGRIKWSPVGASRLMTTIQKNLQNPCFAHTINVNYSDSGLFGVYLVTYSKDAGTALKAALTEFRSVLRSGLTQEELTVAKVRAKSQVMMRAEDGANVVEDMAAQTLTTGLYVSPSELCKQIDALSVADVQQVAKKLSTQKLAMAALGRLDHTPYLDEIAA